jgi:hypothetical protein
MTMTPKKVSTTVDIPANFSPRTFYKEDIHGILSPITFYTAKTEKGSTFTIETMEIPGNVSVVTAVTAVEVGQSSDPVSALTPPATGTPRAVDLRVLQAAAERACQAAVDAVERLPGAINWGNLHCVSAQRVQNERGDKWYRVEIREAEHGSSELCQFVAERLAVEGFNDIEITCDLVSAKNSGRPPV